MAVFLSCSTLPADRKNASLPSSLAVIEDRSRAIQCGATTGVREITEFWNALEVDHCNAWWASVQTTFTACARVGSGNETTCAQACNSIV